MFDFLEIDFVHTFDDIIALKYRDKFVIAYNLYLEVCNNT